LGRLTLSEEHRLRVFENRVLRRMFGLKRDEVKGEWRKVLVRKPEGMRPLGGWDQNGAYGDRLGGVDWIRLAQDRDWWRDVVNSVMNLCVFAPRKC
jgi:hypothetical protein